MVSIVLLPDNIQGSILKHGQKLERILKPIKVFNIIIRHIVKVLLLLLFPLRFVLCYYCSSRIIVHKTSKIKHPWYIYTYV